MTVFSHKFSVLFSSQHLNIIDAYQSVEPSSGFKFYIHTFNLYFCHFIRLYALYFSRKNYSYIKKLKYIFIKRAQIIDKHIYVCRLVISQRLFGVIIVNLITLLEGEGLFHYYGAEVHIPEANCKVLLQSSNCLPSK